MNVLEQVFLRASIDERERDAKQREYQREHQRQLELALAEKRVDEALAKVKAESDRVRRLRKLTVVLALLLFPTVFAGIMGLLQTLSKWQPNSGFPRDPVVSLATAPGDSPVTSGLLCAGTAGIGIGCSRDGETWNVYRQDLPTGIMPTGISNKYNGTVKGVLSIAVDGTNRDHLYAYVGGTGLVSSSNGGVNWRVVGNGAPEERARRIISYGNRILVLTYNSKQLYASADDGENWTQISGPSDSAFKIVYSMHYASSSQMVYIGTDNGLYRGGLGPPWHWEQIASLTKVVFIEDGLDVEPGLTLAVQDASNHTTVYHWPMSGNGICIARFKARLVALSTDPTSSSQLAFALLQNGTTVAMDRHKGEHSLGRWPYGWNFRGDLGQADVAWDLLAVRYPSKPGVQLLIAHPRGLLEYRVLLETIDHWTHSC